MNDVWTLITQLLDLRSNIRLTAVSKDVARAVMPRLPTLTKERTTYEQIMTTWSPLALHVLQKRNPWVLVRAMRHVAQLVGPVSHAFLRCAFNRLDSITKGSNHAKRSYYMSCLRRAIVPDDRARDDMYKSLGIKIIATPPRYSVTLFPNPMTVLRHSGFVIYRRTI